MNHVVTICLTVVAVVSVICATVLYSSGHDGAALVGLAIACVSGVTGFTVGRLTSPASTSTGSSS